MRCATCANRGRDEFFTFCNPPDARLAETEKSSRPRFYKICPPTPISAEGHEEGGGARGTGGNRDHPRRLRQAGAALDRGYGEIQLRPFGRPRQRQADRVEQRAPLLPRD